MSDRQDNLAKGLAVLRQNYRQRLPDEFEKLSGLVKQLFNAPTDSTVLEDVHYRLHKIAGSGGSFGLKALSASARKLELETGDWLEQTSAVDANKISYLHQQLEQFPDLVAGEDIFSEHGESSMIRLDTGNPVEDGMDRNPLIWLLEEDEVLGTEMMDVLMQFDYDVRLFNRFDDAEKASGVDRPDLLIMDLTFQDERMDDSQRLQKSQLLAMGKPIQFISSRDDFQSRLRAVRLGGAGFMAKPLDIPKMVEHLERILEHESSQPFKVLIVDDDVTLSEHFCLVLQSVGMDVQVINDPKTVIDVMTEFRPELILMDIYMPEYSGGEIASLIRQYDEWLGLPIVYLSAETDQEQQLKAMRSGADDFLTKPISDHYLQAAIKIRALRARQLNDLMSKDGLTGLLKHARIKEELDIELFRVQRSGKPLCVVMTDIDHFKRVNDTYGHAIGDRVIKGISHLLKQRFRVTDIIGRYGGEEFAIILPDCGIEMARSIMDDIRQRFEAISFHAGEKRFNVTISAGVACLADCPKSKEILVAADEALYQAKHAGRNQVCVYQNPDAPLGSLY